MGGQVALQNNPHARQHILAGKMGQQCAQAALPADGLPTGQPALARQCLPVGAQALRIREPGWFSLKRTLHIEGEAWTPAIRCFYAVYVLQCKA